MINQFKTYKSSLGFDFDVTFDRESKVNCIIGKNGIGKTQLLENMAKSLLYRHSIFSRNTEYKYGDFFVQKFIKDKIQDKSIQLPLGIELNNVVIKNKDTQKWGWTTFSNIYSNGVKGDFVCDKPIVFIGAKNRGFTKNIDPDNIKILADRHGRFNESFLRTFEYMNGNGLQQEEIANWIVSRLLINPNFVSQSESKVNEVITILKMIEKLEPSLNLVTKNDKGGHTFSVAYQDGKLITDGIPIDKLSTGFISIVKIFQEIVAGYGGWTNESDLSKVDGIVFIDEIEPHLHISWQVKIINVLKEFFPNTTFYISTHSPLVLSGLQDGEAYELIYDENNDIVKNNKIENIENYFLNDMIFEFFGVDINQQKIDNPNIEKQQQAKKILQDILDDWNS